jgi:hypothetical protein
MTLFSRSTPLATIPPIFPPFTTQRFRFVWVDPGRLPSWTAAVIVLGRFLRPSLFFSSGADSTSPRITHVSDVSETVVGLYHRQNALAPNCRSRSHQGNILWTRIERNITRTGARRLLRFRGTARPCSY